MCPCNQGCEEVLKYDYSNVADHPLLKLYHIHTENSSETHFKGACSCSERG